MSEGFLRAGVIGAGVFGGYHAKQYARLDGVVLSAVLDPHHPDRAAAIAVPLGGRAFVDLAAFLAEVDVVTIASPAVTHAEQALAAIAAGKPVYVEKPVAVTLEEARSLANAAEAAGVVVACGHQERVVFQAMGLLDVPEQPLSLEALRHGPPSPRSRDVSAVLDLMIHDIDLALALTLARRWDIGNASARSGPDGVCDEVAADVAFATGLNARFDVSRQAPGRKRSMRVGYPSGELEIDFVARTFRNDTPFDLDPGFADTPAGRDPLGASVESFLDAARGRAPRPMVTLAEAIAALDLALAIERATAPPAAVR